MVKGLIDLLLLAWHRLLELLQRHISFLKLFVILRFLFLLLHFFLSDLPLNFRLIDIDYAEVLNIDE